MAEKIIWNKLRNRQTSGFKFRRQYAIGKYVVDFYCSEINLAIEIDGDVHGYKEKASKDAIKEEFLLSKGFELLRYNNSDIYINSDTVLGDISRKCEELRVRNADTCPHPNPLPEGEETIAEHWEVDRSS